MIIVRPHPDDPADYEIIDGHHRIDVLKELGHTEARCDVWNVDDREAKLLLATLNRLEGQDLPIRRAQLVHELLGEMNIGDLSGLLPETDTQLEELESLLQFPADEVAELLKQQAEEQEKVLPKVWSLANRTIFQSLPPAVVRSSPVVKEPVCVSLPVKGVPFARSSSK